MFFLFEAHLSRCLSRRASGFKDDRCEIQSLKNPATGSNLVNYFFAPSCIFNSEALFVSFQLTISPDNTFTRSGNIHPFANTLRRFSAGEVANIRAARILAKGRAQNIHARWPNNPSRTSIPNSSRAIILASASLYRPTIKTPSPRGSSRKQATAAP
jgi:hypothetical protein